ncbi:MAG TPA: hypothetical protein VMT17_18640 [Anaeromyxobacteraceae bacterium]|nr:hypothetical protein [Anaeromyxobacteraceae bacterium]
MRSLPSRLAPALLVLLCAACSTISTGFGYITGSTQEKEQEHRVAEVQEKVMRYAGDYATQVVQAAARIETPTPEKRLAVLAWQLRQATAAYDIATGPNPILNALDLVVLVSLTRSSVESYWVPVVFGESGRPLLDVCAHSEASAWTIVQPLLESFPKNQLRDAIATWRARNPDVQDVSSIRLVDVEQSEHGTAGLGTPTSILASVGLDPLGKLDPAVQQVERTRILAERALYYAKRWPSLLDLQAQQLALQLSLQPQAQDVLRDANRISGSAEAIGKLAQEIPSLVDREREAAIRQFLDAAQAQEGEARALLAQAKAALDAGQGAFTSADGAIRSLQSFVSMVSAAPAVPGAPPGKPFDVNDYTRGLVELGRAMNDARALVESVERGAPRLETLVQRATQGASQDGRALVDYAFRRGLALVAALLGGSLAVAVLYRLAAARIAARSDT